MSEANRIKIKDWAEICALIIGGLWVVLTFWYEKIVIPQQQPSHLTISSQIEKVSENANFVMLRVKVILRNSSQNKDIILGSWFQIDGYKIITEELNDKAYSDDIQINGSSFFRYPRYFKDDLNSLKVVHIGRITDENLIIYPSQEIQNEYIAVIPKRKFEILRLNVCAITVNNNQKIKLDWKVDSIGRLSPFVYELDNKQNIIEINKTNIELYSKKYNFCISNSEFEYPIGFIKK